jgi:hypothetical protein
MSSSKKIEIKELLDELEELEEQIESSKNVVAPAAAALDGPARNQLSTVQARKSAPGCGPRTTEDLLFAKAYLQRQLAILQAPSASASVSRTSSSPVAAAGAGAGAGAAAAVPPAEASYYSEKEKEFGELDANGMSKLQAASLLLLIQHPHQWLVRKSALNGLWMLINPTTKQAIFAQNLLQK